MVPGKRSQAVTATAIYIILSTTHDVQPGVTSTLANDSSNNGRYICKNATLSFENPTRKMNEDYGETTKIIANPITNTVRTVKLL